MFGKRGSLFWMNMHSMHAEIHTGEMAPGSFLQQDSLKIDDSICSYHSEQMISGYTCRNEGCKGTIWPYIMEFGRLPTACCHVQHICWLWTCQTNMHPFGFNHDETEMQSLMFRLHFCHFCLPIYQWQHLQGHLKASVGSTGYVWPHWCGCISISTGFILFRFKKSQWFLPQEIPHLRSLLFRRCH